MAFGGPEIGVVSDPKHQQNGNASPNNNIAGLVINVYSASAYGELEKLKGFVEGEGHSVTKPDGNGYYALQWAALNNHLAVAQYVIDDHGGDVHAVDNTQQTALHWAAVRGSVAFAELLLRCGARAEAADINGYRAVHVAARYGQATFLNHIVAKYGADFDVPDNDARSPLHWAAYKGFADTVRLPLFRDAYQGRQDKEAPKLPKVTAVIGLWCWIAVFLALASVLMFYRCSSKDPGFIKPSSGQSAKCAGQDDLLNVNLRNWSQLCPTCKRNKWDFFVFLCMGTVTAFLGAAITIHRFWIGSPVLYSGTRISYMAREHPRAITFLFLDVIVLFAALALTVAQASQATDYQHVFFVDNFELDGGKTQFIARNITTNELANAARYSYLREPDGLFHNPYSHGWQKNCTDFLVHGYSNDDEVAWLPL